MIIGVDTQHHLIQCFICNADEDEYGFEPVTFSDGQNPGSITFFICSGCKRDALREMAGKAFSKRFERKKPKEVEE